VLRLDETTKRRLPNAITVARLVLSGAFFAMLGFYEFGTPGAGLVYGVAAATDWVDGHLARRWDVSSDFGKVVDPFCDKILVLGTFVFFASHLFLTDAGESLTGVGPFVVILLLARELFVTTLRGLPSAAGGAMGAKRAGKLKMIFQSIAIPVVLVYVISRGWLERGEAIEVPLRVLREVAVWGTVLVTLWSVWDYLPRRAPA